MSATSRPARALRGGALTLALALAAGAAAAAATDDLRNFLQQVKSGRASFVQTVTAPDGVKQKVSSGDFSFQRPSRFRFNYLKPYAQTIVGDGNQVWIFDPDLNQVTVRKSADALGNTPAALLVGSSLDQAFTLGAQPDADGLQWVQATPRQAEGTVRWLKVGFKDHQLAALEIADSFGQHSRLVFSGFQPNATVAAETFRFVAPPGADVTRQ